MNFGTDLLIVDEEIVWEGDALATVSGEDNVRQQAYLRFLTDLGESVFFKDYGSRFFSYLSKPFNDENKKNAESEARALLLRVGDSNGQGWIEKVISSQIDLVTVDGKQVKRLIVKYVLRGDSTVRDLNMKFEGV